MGIKLLQAADVIPAAFNLVPLGEPGALPFHARGDKAFICLGRVKLVDQVAVLAEIHFRGDDIVRITGTLNVKLKVYAFGGLYLDNQYIGFHSGIGPPEDDRQFDFPCPGLFSCTDVKWRSLPAFIVNEELERCKCLGLGPE